MVENDRESRINTLSQRFQRHAVGRKPETPRSRERRSFYLDGELVQRVDATYREVNHQLHPQAVSKSSFLEALLEYALENLPEVKNLLKQQEK